MPSDDHDASRTPDNDKFMKYPHPDAGRVLARLDSSRVQPKSESRRCIENLLRYRAVRTRARLPRGQSAAVLVPLFVGRSGDLYVLLSRRSDELKAFSGDTALPGGKIDALDRTVEDTARREAFEEIGLPQDKERIPLLCVMEPHLTKGEMLVTPVVVLILDNGLQPNLNSFEVTSIFAQPLDSFLSSTPHFSSGRTADPTIPYHTFTDVPWSDGGAVRLHRFLTGREAEGVKPVFGLTASILIKTATIGYGRPPDFEIQPSNAPTPAQQIAHALLTPANPLRIACEQEGIDTNKTAARLLRSPMAANTRRMVEWEKIGTHWKKLMDDNNATRADAIVSKATGVDSGSGSRPASRDRNSGSENLQERVDEMKQRVLDEVAKGEREGMEGLVARIEKRRRDREEHVDECGKEDDVRRKDQDTIHGTVKLEELLDETRDMVNEQMKEVEGDEKKLAKARELYPKIAEQVKKKLEEVRNGDGKLDRDALFALIPKQSQEGQDGIDAGKEGIKDGAEKRDRGIERGKEGVRRGLEKMKKYVRDGQNSEQAVHKKWDAKL